MKRIMRCQTGKPKIFNMCKDSRHWMRETLVPIGEISQFVDEEIECVNIVGMVKDGDH